MNNEHRLKKYSGYHILSYHSTQNTPRAYLGRPTCFLVKVAVFWIYILQWLNIARKFKYSNQHKMFGFQIIIQTLSKFLSAVSSHWESAEINLKSV